MLAAELINEGGFTERYKTLIQPLKDLAASFDVDITDSLDEYLEALGLQIDNTNFAEAALLIQGSTHAFGKKVDFLHQLVQETVDYITANVITGDTAAGSSKVRSRPNSSSHDLDESMLSQIEPSTVLLSKAAIKHCFKNSTIYLPSSRNRRTKPSGGDAHNSTMRSMSVSRNSAMVMQTILDESCNSIKLNSSTVDRSTGALLLGPIDSSRRSIFSEGRHSIVRTSVIRSVADMEMNVAKAVSTDAVTSEDVAVAGHYGGDDETDGGQAFDHRSLRMSISPIHTSHDDSFRYEQREVPLKVPPKKISPLALQDPHEIRGVSRPLVVGRTSSRATPRREASAGYFSLHFQAALGGMLATRERTRREAQRTSRLEQRLLRVPDSRAHEDSHHYAVFNDDGADEDYGFEAEAEELVFAASADVAFAPVRDVFTMDERSGSIEDFQTDYFEALDPSSDAIADERDGDGDYERVCRAHLEVFMREAESFAKDTQLSARVSAWSKRLEPILQAEEIAPSFDIQQYCKSTLRRARESSADGGSDVPFKAMVQGCSALEVSRVFLSCLQLVNAGEFAIKDIGDRSDTLGRAEKDLLNGSSFIINVLSQSYLKKKEQL